MSISKVIFLPR